MIDQLDNTHTESVLARMAIRDQVNAYRSMFILGWVPRPMPPDYQPAPLTPGERNPHAHPARPHR